MAQYALMRYQVTVGEHVGLLSRLSLTQWRPEWRLS